MSGSVAVTGATGRIGAPLVDALLRAGRTVRALSRRPQSPRAGVEWVIGDLLDTGALDALVAGSETLFHAGGETHGPPDIIERTLVAGTDNVLRAASAIRTVHISSLVVLDTGSPASPQLIDEDSPLEPFPSRRGDYTRAKCAAEELARAAAARQDVVIVRPGLVVSDGDVAIPPAVGVRLGIALCFVGPGDGLLPMVHAEDVAAGLQRAADGLERGGLVHLIDPMPVTRAALFRRLAPGGRLRAAIPSGGLALSVAHFAAKGHGRIAGAAYRLQSAGTPHRWNSDRARTMGWSPVALRKWLSAGLR